MPISSDELSKLLREHPENQLEDFAEARIFAGVPFIFASEEEMSRFQGHIAESLGISHAAPDILIVGSAKTGFSLDPDRFPIPFHAGSDIDIAVIDTGFFDEAWRLMLAWDYLTMRGRSYAEKQWLWKRQYEVWSGWYDPSSWHLSERRGIELSFPMALKPLRDFAHLWFSAFRSLSRYRHHPEVSRHKISARLYRTRRHAAMYHAMGLRLLRGKLVVEQKNAI